MPILNCTYNPSSKILRGSHLSTILPSILGKSDSRNFQTRCITLEDGAEIELDWLKGRSKKLLVLLPGLEGHSKRIYTSRTAQAAFKLAWDVLLVNYRGSNGTINPVAKTYHGGAIDDLHDVLSIVLGEYPEYQSVCLGGFSLGGNIVLNYLGNPHLPKSNLIKRAICFSVPCDFTSSSPLLNHGFNHWVYGKRFVKSLLSKVENEKDIFEGRFDRDRFQQIKTLRDFDDVFTSRVNGFKDANDYYLKVSSLQFLDQIEIPTLLVSAENDPMLSDSCYPRAIAERSPLFHLEVSEFGGHVGFANDLSFKNFYYADRLATWLE